MDQSPRPRLTRSSRYYLTFFATLMLAWGAPALPQTLGLIVMIAGLFAAYTWSENIARWIVEGPVTDDEDTDGEASA